MPPSDSHRLALQQLAASIRAWSGFVADVARIEVIEDGDGWRLTLAPFVAGACPLDLTMHGAEPSCDLRLGGHAVEGWRPASFDAILPIVEAVVDGRIVTRDTRSAATGLALATTSHIRLADGREICIPGEAVAGAGPVECRDTHWLPYRR